MRGMNPEGVRFKSAIIYVNGERERVSGEFELFEDFARMR